MKLGFIGYGSMGNMIINGLLNAGALDMGNLIISNRNRDKLKELKLNYPLIEITDNNSLVAKKSDKIFIFVNTEEVKNVIEEIKPHIKSDIHIIHIAAGLNMSTIQNIFPGKITKVIPSLTSLTNIGISLINHNKKVLKEDKKYVEDLLGFISEIKIIDEDDFEAGANLTSSAPAFFALIISKYIELAKENSSFSQEEAEEMVKTTLYGTSQLLCQGMEFEEIIFKVATKGGITEEGITLLDSSLESVFKKLFKKTEEKYGKFKLELEREYRF